MSYPRPKHVLRRIRSTEHHPVHAPLFYAKAAPFARALECLERGHERVQERHGVGYEGSARTPKEDDDAEEATDSSCHGFHGDAHLLLSFHEVRCQRRSPQSLRQLVKSNEGKIERNKHNIIREYIESTREGVIKGERSEMSATEGEKHGQ